MSQSTEVQKVVSSQSKTEVLDDQRFINYQESLITKVSSAFFGSQETTEFNITIEASTYH